MTATTPWLWTLIFGGFYFAYRKAWLHSLGWFVVVPLTLFVAWLVYPFFADRLLTATYKSRGWERVA